MLWWQGFTIQMNEDYKQMEEDEAEERKCMLLEELYKATPQSTRYPLFFFFYCRDRRRMAGRCGKNVF